MASRQLIVVLTTMMLVTGVCNTLITKYQDMQCVRNCDDPDPKKRVLFEAPVLQTLQMFVGEMGSWIVVLATSLYRRYKCSRAETALLAGGYNAVEGADDSPDMDDEGETTTSPLTGITSANPAIKDSAPEHLRGWRIGLLAAPTCCDITGTTLMNVGLLFVVASIYQMTRGALVLFVGLFSVLFLRRHLYVYQWFALVTVVLGVGLVGLAGAIAQDPQPSSSPAEGATATAAATAAAAGQTVKLLVRRATHTSEALRATIGVGFIALAQIFTAFQFVLEEWILERYELSPLEVVGWEGVFGFVATAVGMAMLHLAVGCTPAGRGGYFDATEGLRAVVENRAVAVSSVLTMLSIGGYNYFGISVTRSVSATSRSTIDTCRTLFIWALSLWLGWENFKWLQVVGFSLLVYGTFLFNNIVRPPMRACLLEIEREELLPEEPIEHI